MLPPENIPYLDHFNLEAKGEDVTATRLTLNLTY